MPRPRLFSAMGLQASKRPQANQSGADQAFLLLRIVFTAAPIGFGVDKFFGVLTNWDQYLAPWINDLVPGTTHQAMLAVGVVEILAGILVAVRPGIGAYVIVAWLAGIILNLLTLGNYYDVALRDFGLLVGALALARLAGQPFRTVNSATTARPAATGDAR